MGHYIPLYQITIKFNMEQDNRWFINSAKLFYAGHVC